jgi:energy-coupling factor transport system substrate-specific component
MSSLAQAQRPASPGRVPAWRTRDILITAVVGVVFGVVFFAWNNIYAAFAFLQPSILQDWTYGMWLVPAVLAPLIIRKPGAALFAELVAASISALLGSQWGPDTLLSGFIQGAAAELVFAVTGYRRWSFAVLALAAVASASGAWAHDWWLYYADVSVELQVARLLIMGASAIGFAALGSIALVRSLRRAGVLQGFAN